MVMDSEGADSVTVLREGGFEKGINCIQESNVLANHDTNDPYLAPNCILLSSLLLMAAVYKLPQ